VWTGTLPNGRTLSVNRLGEPNPIIGFSNTTDSGWVDGGNLSTGQAEHFYAMSGILVAPVPEPSAMVLACLAVTGLAIAAVRKCG
jgi:hypothetical protein